MGANYNKLTLGRTLENMGGTPTSDGCHNYGIVAGCDAFCPTLLDGKCKQHEEALAVCDFSRDEKEEILNLYT